MSFEKYLRKKQIEKEATEAASKSVNKLFSSSCMRSEFERLFTAQRSYRSSDKEAFIRGCEAAYKHQQSKVDEIQRRNQMLNDNIKEQGQKLVYQSEVIETQAEKLLGLRDEKAELQKRVDAVQKLIREWKEWVKNNQSHNVCVYIEESITELEQAIKGGDYHLEKVEELLDGRE